MSVHSSILKIEKSYKNIGIYNIGYITIKNISDFENINCVNPLYLIIDKVDGYIEEKNGDKYVTFASIDGNKKVLEKYKKISNGTKYKIEGNSIEKGEYEKAFIKIKFNSDDNLPLGKILKLHMLK